MRARLLDDERRVLLRDRIHHGQRGVDLLDADALLLRRSVIFAHYFAKASGCVEHGLDRPSACVTSVEPSAAAPTESATSNANVLRSRRRVLRGESTSAATTAKPRPCTPARAVSTAAFKGEDIGLERDAPDDSRDVRGSSSNWRRCAPWSCSLLRRHRCPSSRPRGRLLRDAIACCARVSIAAHRISVRPLMLAAVCSSDAALFFRPRGQIQRAGSNLTNGRTDRFTTVAHRRYRLREPRLHLMQSVEQLSHFIGAVTGNRAAQISGRNGVEMRETRREAVQRSHGAAPAN